MNCPGIFFLLTLFCTTYGGFLRLSPPGENRTEDCGRTRYENDSINIVNYEKAEIGQFPWVARVGMKSPTEGEGPIFYCGGSLISPTYVISDVNCGNLGHIVRVGDTNVINETDCDDCGICAPPVQDIPVKKRIYEDNCNLATRNSIILLELEVSADLNEFVQPICLPDSPLSARHYDDDRFLTPGFGDVHPQLLERTVKSMPFTEMRYINSTLLDPELCNKIYPEPLHEEQLCVGYPDGIDHHCVGDSGGPLLKFVKEDEVTRAYLVGITKYNSLMCEMEDKPRSIYTDISKFIDWIKKKIMESDESEEEVDAGDSKTSEEDSMVDVGDSESSEEVAGDDKTSEDNSKSVAGDDETSEENSKSVAGDDATSEENSKSVAGDDETSEENSKSVVGDDETSAENSTIIGGDNETSKENSTLVVGDDEANEKNSTLVVEDKETGEKNSTSVVGDNAANEKNSTTTVGDKETSKNSTVVVGDDKISGENSTSVVNDNKAKADNSTSVVGDKETSKGDTPSAAEDKEASGRNSTN